MRKQKTPNQNSKKKKESPQNEDRVRSLQDSFKHTNIHITGVPEGETEQEIENLSEKVMIENFTNLVKEGNMQVPEAQRVPNKMNPQRSILRHVMIKMPKIKDKEKILKAVS